MFALDSATRVLVFQQARRRGMVELLRSSRLRTHAHAHARQLLVVSGDLHRSAKRLPWIDSMAASSVRGRNQLVA